MSDPVSNTTTTAGLSLAGLMTGAAPAAPAPAPVLAAPAQIAPAQLSVGQQAAPVQVVSGSSTQIAFGQKVESIYVPRFKGVMGYTKRIAVINANRIFVENTHYSEGSLKEYHCFGGSCCKSGIPKQNYLVPVQAYDCDKEGNPISAKISFEFLKCPPHTWDLLGMIHRTQPIDQIDLFVMCEDDKFQKIKFVPAGPAIWRQPANANFAQLLAAEYNAKIDRVLRSAAKYLGKLPDNHDDVVAMAQYRKECEAAYAKSMNETVAVAAGVATAAAEQRPAFNMSDFLSGNK